MLKCKNLTKKFGSICAVSDLSFEVQEGEIFGIAGPNGAGKTTLFNLITGVYQGSGEIVFDGKNLMGLNASKICHKGIARTFQTPEVFLTLPVVKNVKVGAHFGNSGIRNQKENIRTVIDFVGLNGKEDVVGSDLKLLDKKLLMIAAALATKPKLLLLDEPIAGLSPEETRQSVDMFKKINKELGITIIIIEHFMKVLTELSDQLLILQNGGKVCIDSPHRIANNKQVIECYLGEDYA